jgi:hypothetical protein
VPCNWQQRYSQPFRKGTGTRSTDAVQAYRDTLQAEEAKEWDKLREPILEKLSEDMAKLNGAKDMDDFEFAEVGSQPQLPVAR